MGSNRIDKSVAITYCLAFAIMSYSAYVALVFARQPLLDLHSFRQTQTALTSFWFMQNGLSLSYETPVGGSPWSIPFEFPIYQAIVAYVAKTLDVSLDGTGRIVSYLFLLVTILPIASIIKTLKLPKNSFIYFIVLVFSSPLYLYWGRSFMIETTALFFGVVAIKFFLEYLLVEKSLRKAISFMIFATLCILQKATTALPILFVLGLGAFLHETLKVRSIGLAKLTKQLFWLGLIFILPILIGYLWVSFTDTVKINNSFGKQLTSNALFEWNWGTTSQRLTSETWYELIINRTVTRNMGGYLGAFLIFAPFVISFEPRIRIILLGLIALGILPLVFFTNLHLKHDYYQFSNIIFLIISISIILAILAEKFGKYATLLILVLLAISNYIEFHERYMPIVRKEFSKEYRAISIGDIIKRNLQPSMQFIAFGNDWSSTFSYISERKSFTVPAWFHGYNKVIYNPEKFLDDGRMGGMVSCTRNRPSDIEIFDWADKSSSWTIGETNGCLIVVPKSPLPVPQKKLYNCIGHIDRAEIQLRNGEPFLVFAGWAKIKNETSLIPSQVFLNISHRYTDANPMVLDTLRIPRLDANRAHNINYDSDIGFSRVLKNSLKDGTYNVELMIENKNGFGSCGIYSALEVKTSN